LAVPGRWRTITLPAMRTTRPLGTRARSAARVTRSASISARRRPWVLADGQTGAVIIGEEALAGVHGGERRWLADFLLAGEQRTHRQDGALRLPESVAAMGLAERIERADFGQAIDFVFAQFADAQIARSSTLLRRALGAGAQDGRPASSRSPRA
jgi:hypothetical protein